MSSTWSWDKKEGFKTRRLIDADELLKRLGDLHAKPSMTGAMRLAIGQAGTIIKEMMSEKDKP